MDVVTTAVSFLVPYLTKASEKAAEKIGEQIPEAVGKVWNAIMAKFKGNAVAEAAVVDVAAEPDDADNQAAFRKELRKVATADPVFAAELERLLMNAQNAGDDTIMNIGSGAVATKGGVAAGEGGIAIKGDVHGNVSAGTAEKKG